MPATLIFVYIRFRVNLLFKKRFSGKCNNNSNKRNKDRCKSVPFACGYSKCTRALYLQCMKYTLVFEVHMRITTVVGRDMIFYNIQFKPCLSYWISEMDQDSGDSSQIGLRWFYPVAKSDGTESGLIISDTSTPFRKYVKFNFGLGSWFEIKQTLTGNRHE